MGAARHRRVRPTVRESCDCSRRPVVHPRTPRLRHVDESPSPQLGVRSTPRAHRGQGPRSGYPGAVREPGVHVPDVPRLRPPRFAVVAGGIPMHERRVLGFGVPSGYRRGRQTASGGQPAICDFWPRRPTSLVASTRGKRAFLGNRDAMTRRGMGAVVTRPQNTERRVGNPDGRPSRRTVLKPPMTRPPL